MSRARLVDVAAKAGVSRTTASTALSGGGRISEETRQHVLTVAAEMGYEVNRQAANLRIQRAGAIGVYVPPDATGYQYYLEFAFGVVDEAMRRGTPVVLVPHGTTEVSLARDHVDGYIVIDAADDDQQVRRILATGLPVVAADPLPGSLTDGLTDGRSAAGTVTFDHGRPVHELLDHLAARGARRIALISPPLDTSWARQVNDAYLRWCADHSRNPRIVNAPFLADATNVEQPVGELFDPPAAKVPDAVVVAQDGIASAVSAAITARGYPIGTDVLLAACVDGLAVRTSIPPITAIDLMPREHGKTCARMLLALLSDSPPVTAPTVVLQPELHLRTSTGSA